MSWAITSGGPSAWGEGVEAGSALFVFINLSLPQGPPINYVTPMGEGGSKIANFGVTSFMGGPSLKQQINTLISAKDHKKPEVILDTEVWSWGKGKQCQLGHGDMLDR